MTTIEFRAPWSAKLRNNTVFTVVCYAVMVIAVILVRLPALAAVLLIGLATLALARAVAGRVRGYTLTEDAITVHRGLWDTRLPLTGLRSVTGDVDAMGSWIRMWAWSAFSITGTFWSRKLGWYRAFATDPSRAVVLRYPKRTIVITPHDPQHFIMRAGTLIKVAGFPK